MKIVINTRPGGFGLSQACFLDLVEHDRAGLEHIESMYEEVELESFFPCRLENAPNVRHTDDTSLAPYAYDEVAKECISVNNTAADLRRNQRLIEAIETKGPGWAAGPFCRGLKVVEVPDDVVVTVVTADNGSEHVAEKHRTWS